MDIEIPDPQDLELMRVCSVCRGTRVQTWWNDKAGPLKGKKQKPTGEYVKSPCPCTTRAPGGAPDGFEWTPVGERVIDLLKALGVLDSTGRPRG
jgi:hypothetical protein